MYDLSGNGIYQARKTVEAFLAGDRIDHRQAVRLCMTLEEALLNCQEHFGESTPFTLKTKKLLGRIQIVIQIAGESFDPFNNALDDDLNLLRKLNADAANTCAWSYRNGVNTVSLVPRKERKFSSSVKTLLAIVLAVCLGLACAKLPDAIRVPLLESFVAPTLNTIMGVISAVAGPMIFFSLVWGVCTISDVSTLSRIGKRMLGRFMLELFVLSALATLLCYPFFRAASGGSASFQADEFYKLLLGIIPDNMISPFLNGNTQQIIFLAVIGGIVLLLLGERASAVTTFVNHMNLVIQYIMKLANTLIPFMVFLSIFKIVLSGQFAVLSKAYKLVPVFLGLSLLLLLLYTLAVSVGQKVSAFSVLQKVIPVFVLGLTTASSSAALAPNLKTCEESLGIDKKIVSFGVPLGQTLFKPGGLLRFVTIGFCMAELYGIPVTANWLAVMILNGFLLAIAAPPVAGGAAVCFAILFEQLGVPADAIGYALAINVLFDFVLTAVNLYCLDMELTGLAKSLSMLDRETLVKRI